METRVGIRCISGRSDALEQALADAIARRRASDVLGPLAVLVGGTLMRPYLQRRLADLLGGVVNVSFLMPSDLALVLGERRVVADGRAPLPPLADRVLLRQVAAEHDGYFSPVRDTPGFAEALHRLVRELRAAGYDQRSFTDAVRNACEVPEKGAALAEIFEEFLRRRAGFFGPDDCLLAADPDGAAWGSIYVYGVWEAPPALRTVLESLAARVPVTFFLPVTGTVADDAHLELREWLIEKGAHLDELQKLPSGSTLECARDRLFGPGSGAIERDDSLRLLSGPDPTREVREVARTCLAWAGEGIPFHDMAIAYRNAEVYRPVVEAVFGEAGVPIYLHEGSPLIERPVGRQSAALLDLTAGNLERRAVMDFLTDVRLPKQTHELYGGVPAPRWDRISRDAGVVEGARQWQERVAARQDELRERGYGADVEHAETLMRFIRDLGAALRDHPAVGSWAEHLQGLRSLLTRYVDGADAILDPLDALARFDSLHDQVSFERFREVVHNAIETLRSDEVLGTRQGAFGRRGVNVLDVNSLRHVRFRAVALLGVNERQFPSPPRPDPLLLDHERVRFNAARRAPLPLRVRRPDPEPLQFALAVTAARHRLTVSFARKNAEGRAQLPSSFFRQLAAAVVGEPVGAEGVDELPADLYMRASGGRIGAATPAEAISPADHDRTLVEADAELGRATLAAFEPRLASGFAARDAALARELTPFDGALDETALEALLQIRPHDRPFSPSSLETYAQCPHRFFLETVLRAKPVEEPEETRRISPLARGSLVHRVLERFLGEPPEGGALLHGGGEHDRLMRILDEVCDESEAHGETGYPLIWRYDRSELREDMRRWLEAEREDPAFAAVPLGRFEASFGSDEDPLEITADGVRLRVRGRIDRLNWDEQRSQFRVIDYKTGRAWEDHVDGALRGGRALQLPIYLLAGARITGIDPRRGSAEYHFATRRGGFERRTFSGDDLGARSQDIDRLLAGFVNGVRTGDFHMSPAKREDDCRRCDFDGLCPTSRFSRIDRKAGDPREQALASLREVE